MTEHSRRQHKPNRNKSTKSNDIKEMERFFKIAHIPKINLPDKKDTQDAKVIPSTPFESQEELSTECEGCGENAACKKSRPAGMILCRNCEAIAFPLVYITDSFEADAERQRELHRQIPKITSLIRSSSSEAKTIIEWHMMKFFPDSVVGILLSKALAEINAGEHEKGAVTLESIWPAPEPPRDGFSVPEEEIQLRHGVLTVDQKEEMYGQWEVQAGRLLTFANKPVATIHRDANQGGEPVVLDKLVRILAAHLNETRQTPDTIYKQAMRER